MLAFRAGRLRLAARRIGLPAWFVTIDLVYSVFNPDAFAIDARLYQRAADAWLARGDPWAVAEQGVLFAAGPHTLLFYAPTSLLPLQVSIGVWMVAGLAASVWLVRRLGLPLWWLAFPPLAHGIWNGNPQTIALALLVVGGPIAAPLAAGLKLYAVIPLLGRWRDLLVAAAVLAAALVVLPVGLYLAAGAGLADHLDSAWNGSAWRLPILVPPTLLALWLLRRHGSEWLAIPAAWPATQLYYNAMALPALVGRPVLAAALAIPVPLLPVVAVIGYALAVSVPRSRLRWVGMSASEGQARGRTPTSTAGDRG